MVTKSKKPFVSRKFTVRQCQTIIDLHYWSVHAKDGAYISCSSRVSVKVKV